MATRTNQGIATLSIVFKDQRTISSLPELTKTLATWNKVIPVYHQLIKSKAPEDIQIVEVQNGSIDLIVNLDVDVAVNLADLFKIGFQVFAAYLAYKKMAKPIIDSYHGNQKLIAGEKDREQQLLENIGTAIQSKIEIQHKESKKVDKKIDSTAIPKKIEQVTKLVTSHIVKGNDIKLLGLPETEEPEDGQEDRPDEREALREQSMVARQQLRLIPAEAQQKLIEAYGQIDEKQD